MRGLARLTPTLLLTLAATVHAGAGVSLRWDNCYSDSGVVNKTFACNTNSGSERLVMSFVLGDAMPEVSGTEIQVAVVPSTATLPAWWQFKNPGTCRTAALTMSVVPPPGIVNCTDWSNGTSTGGIGAYSGSTTNPNGMEVKLAVAVPLADIAALDADQEYLAGTLVISHAKTVGTGACGGCDQPVCLALDGIKVTTTSVATDIRLVGPAFGTGGDFARWQNAQEIDPQLVCSHIGCNYQFSCQLSSTPTRSSTWGAVKALYR